jgi:hypothetical protein
LLAFKHAGNWHRNLANGIGHVLKIMYRYVNHILNICRLKVMKILPNRKGSKRGLSEPIYAFRIQS